MSILKQLLDIVDLRHDCENVIDCDNVSLTVSDDREQYLKMAMKIDPNDPDVLER